MKIVVKIGGSVSIGKTGPKFAYFSRLIPVLRELNKRNQMIVVIGGGGLTRNYGKSIQKFSLSNEEREEIFIQLLKANVLFVSSLLGMKSIFSLEEVMPNTSGVIGGIAPGRSTDANGAIAAKRINADLYIKLTNVDGVYDRDPNRYSGARKLDRLRYEDMKKLAVKGKPNSYGVLDRMAVETLASSGIRTVIINGKNPGDVLKVIGGKKIGTIIEN